MLTRWKRPFTRKDHLNGHVSAVHEGKKPFKCTICAATFSQKPHLKAHVLSNHKVHDGTKLNNCTNCAATFSKKNGLTRHLKNVHEREKC